MAEFYSDIRDLKFVLREQLRLGELLGKKPYADFSLEDVEMILDEAYKFAREVMAPANEPGDREGCRLEDGKLTVPEAFRKPYEMYCEAGWLGLNHSAELGGQGAPQVLRVAADDMMFGANITLNLGMLLTPGAAHLIENFGTEQMRATYCEKMYTGKWGGTMCLTEPQAGSDVGASTTKALEQGDHYLIQGDKIFITFGDHDLTENIIHCVLARIEGAPAGTQGLSLFVVPKYRVEPDGSLGAFNDVVCTAIEHKLGINGSPTCQMTFGGEGKCHGWLLGEENQGMRLMFQMMNEARIAVGQQGAALANAAYQSALRYARERLQGSDISRFKDPDAPRVPIIRHPDVQQMLLRQKAYAEGMRALLLFTTAQVDAAIAAEDEAERQHHDALVDILTPVCKAYCSDMGFRVTEWALQTYGGYGYLKDYPAEQYLRDCKIASIYEGTNGIQALDLVGRKLGGRGGANLMALVKLLAGFIEQHTDHPQLGGEVSALAKARDAWGEANAYLMKCAAERRLLGPLFGASTYLSLCGDLVLGYLLLDQAVIAWDALAERCGEAGVEPTDTKAVLELAATDPEVRYYQGKLATARFFCARELPNVHAKRDAVVSGDPSPMQLLWEDPA